MARIKQVDDWENRKMVRGRSWKAIYKWSLDVARSEPDNDGLYCGDGRWGEDYWDRLR